MDALTRQMWVALPRAVARRSVGLGTLVADGYVLTGLGRMAGVLPFLALAAGLATGALHPGFDEAFTESLALMVVVLAVGTVSTQLGLWLTVGFAVGDFFVNHTSWMLRSTVAEPSGPLSDPLVANLVYERVPLIIEYLLLAGLAVGVPMGARALAASVALRIRLPSGVHLVVTAVLVAVTSFVLARFWAGAAPLVIRPVFTWTIDDGINGAAPPAGAIVPVQSNVDWISRTAVVAALCRIGLTAYLAGTRREVVAEAEASFAEPIGGSAQRGPLATLLQAILAAGLGVLFLAGMIDELWVAFVLGVVFLLARLAKSGWLPLPTRRWRRLVGKVPVLVRFGLVLLVMNAVARAVLERNLFEGRESFTFMVWPIAASALLMAIVVPDPVTEPEASPERETERVPA